MADHQLDLSSEPSEGGACQGGRRGRRYVGIRFACCAVYARVYINREETAYVGHCPRCGRAARLRIGPEGTDCRFFTAY